MNEKYRKAGFWNILSGALALVSTVGIFVFMILFMIIVDGDGAGGALAFLLLLMAVAGGAVSGMGFVPIIMIITGNEMRKGNTQGAAMKTLFAANVVMKLLQIVVCLTAAYEVFAETYSSNPALWISLAVILILPVTLSISVVKDFQAFFQRKENC